MGLFKAKPKPVAATYPSTGWHADYDRLLDGLDSNFHSGWLPGKLRNVIRAMATAESDLDNRQIYREADGNFSVGLLQLSVSDAANYKFMTSEIKQREDLMKPLNNLKLGVEILRQLHAHHPTEQFLDAGGRYWSTLRPSRTGYKRFTEALDKLQGAGSKRPVEVAVTPAHESGAAAEPTWLQIARRELGVHETPGSKSTARIIEYGRATTLAPGDDETPWCSIFVNWCMQQAEVSRTKSAMARSWLKWGTALTKPKLGCIVVFWRGNPAASTGHVSFYVGEDGANIFCLGGNQGDAVKISSYSKSQVLGYRWPS